MRSLPAVLASVVVVALAGCGTQQHVGPNTRQADGNQVVGPVLHGHPQAVEPVAGSGAPTQGRAGATIANATTGGVAGISVGPPVPGLAQPVSDAQIRRELAASGITAQAGRATLTPDGLAVPPANAPPIIKEMINAGNQIAHLPYRFGGGHASFVDTAYDCSGSLSYVFASAGLLSQPVTSGQLMTMGAAGAGRWVTIYANQGHTFMYIAGLRFDTVALAETGTRWSTRPADEPDLASFAVRHPPGL